ncbi:DUF4340 domain-containing protein [bacterium]|nr:DUF4340 domain-containing protein [bacterium]
MNAKRPILAIVAFACLLAFYLWDVDHTERSQLSALQSQQVFFHDSSRVVELEFRNDLGSVTLERPNANTAWRVVKPRSMGANDVIIAAWLENLRGARRQAEFAPEPGTDYGLEKPRAEVKLGIKDDKGSIGYTTIQLGAQPNQFGPVYARLEGEPNVFTVSDWFFKQARKQLADVRDKHLVPPESTGVKRIEVQSARGTSAMERESPSSNDWFTAVAGRPIPADKVVVERFMGVLGEGQFLEIIDAPTSSTMQLGLEPPTLTVTGDGKPLFEVGLRIPGREQFVVRNAAGTVGIAGRSTVGEFFRPATEWTTKRMVWLNPASIRQIEISSGNARANLLRDKGGWIMPDMAAVPIRNDRVESFLEALASTSAQRFIRSNVPEDELMDYGIVEESYNLLVTGDDGTVQGLRFGRTDTSEGMAFVWRRQDQSLWKIDFTAQGRLFRFRRDFEERRLLPDVAGRVGRMEVEIGPNRLVLEKKGAAWNGTMPGESAVVIPPAKIDGFLEAFQDLDVTSEMSLMGTKTPASVFHLYEVGAKEPYATVSLLARNRQSRAGVFEMDGRVIEVDGEQFDVFDEAMASLVISIKEQAQIGRRNGSAPK